MLVNIVLILFFFYQVANICIPREEKKNMKKIVFFFALRFPARLHSNVPPKAETVPARHRHTENGYNIEFAKTDTLTLILFFTLQQCVMRFAVLRVYLSLSMFGLSSRQTVAVAVASLYLCLYVSVSNRCWMVHQNANAQCVVWLVDWRWRTIERKRVKICQTPQNWILFRSLAAAAAAHTYAREREHGRVEVNQERERETKTQTVGR